MRKEFAERMEQIISNDPQTVFITGDIGYNALEKLQAGATLVQVYSGLVYEGPGLAKTLVRGLIQSAENA